MELKRFNFTINLTIECGYFKHDVGFFIGEAKRNYNLIFFDLMKLFHEDEDPPIFLFHGSSSVGIEFSLQRRTLSMAVNEMVDLMIPILQKAENYKISISSDYSMFKE